MTARLNARIDAELARKVKYLRERTRSTTTEIVRASLEAYYEKLSQSGTAADLLGDFVGSGRANAELSTNYKRAFTQSLRRKTRRNGQP